MMVRIRLLCDVPVSPKYGMLAGREFDAEKVVVRSRGESHFLVQEQGEAIKLWPHEVEEIDGEH